MSFSAGANGTDLTDDNNKGSFRALSRHPTYYINGGDIYFLIQQYIFRTHRYFFERESTYFQRQLQLPVSPGAIKHGSDESHAIILDVCTSDEFAQFLWVFYNPKYSLYNAPWTTWTTIIRLAHTWGFEQVHALCTRELEKLYVADATRIALYQKYNVDPNLLVPRYATLCEREEPLSDEEGTEVGISTALKIMRAREVARSPSLGGFRSPTKAEIEMGEMESLVRQLFKIPIPEADPTSSSSKQEAKDLFGNGNINGGANGTTPITPSHNNANNTGGLGTAPIPPQPPVKEHDQPRQPALTPWPLPALDKGSSKIQPTSSLPDRRPSTPTPITTTGLAKTLTSPVTPRKPTETKQGKGMEKPTPGSSKGKKDTSPAASPQKPETPKTLSKTALKRLKKAQQELGTPQEEEAGGKDGEGGEKPGDERKGDDESKPDDEGKKKEGEEEEDDEEKRKNGDENQQLVDVGMPLADNDQKASGDGVHIQDLLDTVSGNIPTVTGESNEGENVAGEGTGGDGTSEPEIPEILGL